MRNTVYIIYFKPLAQKPCTAFLSIIIGKSQQVYTFHSPVATRPSGVASCETTKHIGGGRSSQITTRCDHFVHIFTTAHLGGRQRTRTT